MGASDWLPTFQGMKLTMTKEPIWATKIHTSSSGLESRIALQGTPRYRYSMEIEFLRTAKNNNECATLIDFLNARAGSWDWFFITDPSTTPPIAQKVRFEGDGFTMKQFAHGYYSAQFKLITVKETA